MKFKKSKNGHFSKGVKPWFWSKNGHLETFFLGNICQENIFNYIPERKNAIVSYKNKKFKKSKNWNFSEGVNPWFWSNNWPFSKGVNPWFWSENGHFSTFFFLGNIGQENVFNDILKRKNAFLRYKNKKFKKSKNWHFSKGVNPWFWSKNGHFSNFFF